MPRKGPTSFEEEDTGKRVSNQRACKKIRSKAGVKKLTIASRRAGTAWTSKETVVGGDPQVWTFIAVRHGEALALFRLQLHFQPAYPLQALLSTTVDSTHFSSLTKFLVLQRPPRPHYRHPSSTSRMPTTRPLLALGALPATSLSTSGGNTW